MTAEIKNQPPISNQKNDYLIPIAIVLAGALIAGGLYFSGLGTQPVANLNARPTDPKPTGSLEAMLPITETDYIKGDPMAPIKIVEYSDFECPFCQRFHNTMNQIMAEYGESGQVAWVFRQFPLDQLHPIKAKAEAVASECAGKLGGNETFWQFTDQFFTVTLTNNQTDITTAIPKIIQAIGLDAHAFETCFTSGEFDEKINRQIENAFATGGQGTPWSILVAPDGSKFPINGAQPYATIKQMIDSILAQS